MRTASLEALQSSEQRKLMDLVDRLRRTGLNTLMQLPQIVVCGDQSSGKSSVLEAITEIPFPRKENLCTRFATEISLRRDTEEVISCKINPDEGRTEEEISRLRGFSRTIQDFDALPSLIDEATAAMGLGPSKAFSKDVLCVEICGPSRPHLTLIDLPGLIHASNRSQSEDDVELIRSLVKDYISKQRTIVLAVVSAKNDYANQIILKMCRESDTKGARTLDIITKPDFLRPGSENEATWLDLACNKDIFFELGWHLLKNRADDQHTITFAERNLEEQAFFQDGNYSALSRSMVGVDSLRGRLSHLLFSHLQKALPDLQNELNGMLSKTLKSLDILGSCRDSLSSQRIFLTDLATSTSNIVRMGCNGIYEDPFFGNIDVDGAVDSERNFVRLRAVVQHLNLRFAEATRLKGHTFHIERELDLKEIDDDAHDAEPWIPTGKNTPRSISKPVKMNKQQASKWVNHIQERIRGRELPGIFNHSIIGYLFQQQSTKWALLARKHIEDVAGACKRFVLAVLDIVAAPEIKKKIAALTILPRLKDAHMEAMADLDRILEDKARHPITYNHYFTDNIQKLQKERLTKHLVNNTQKTKVKAVQDTFGHTTIEKDYIDPFYLKCSIGKSIEQDMSKFATEQALDAHDAFYKDERKYFVDAVTKQAIERRLLAPLVEVLSPRSIAGYTDEKVQAIAAEPPEVRQLRAHLENRRMMLEEGEKAFHVAIGGL
ncbi:dynamin family protein [Paraphaeosphaeria minitans]|uniref:Dynamin family protein n=1 Tax=Paraphaeosphaeria minitans TaxID=565426 RepID=A0A9P6KKK6_9PLEO|nr:dynamin family protein [Paraphaeosphaeria minitans]